MSNEEKGTCHTLPSTFHPLNCVTHKRCSQVTNNTTLIILISKTLALNLKFETYYYLFILRTIGMTPDASIKIKIEFKSLTLYHIQ